MLAAPTGLPLHEALGSDKSNFTPLHYAAMSGNIAGAVTLIQEMMGLEERVGEGEEGEGVGGMTRRFLGLRDCYGRTALHIGFFFFFSIVSLFLLYYFLFCVIFFLTTSTPNKQQRRWREEQRLFEPS